MKISRPVFLLCSAVGCSAGGQAAEFEHRLGPHKFERLKIPPGWIEVVHEPRIVSKMRPPAPTLAEFHIPPEDAARALGVAVTAYYCPKCSEGRQPIKAREEPTVPIANARGGEG